MTEPNYKNCPSHCCPVHGCKYGYEGCPVYTKQVVPEPNERWPNNGCERCEADREELAYLELQAGEPIRPVSEFCAAMAQYAHALKQCADEGKEGPFGSPEICEQVAASLLMGLVGISKSNLAHRLLYGREKLRTKKCPIHDGCWSGIAWTADECECLYGNNITGWLPND